VPPRNPLESPQMLARSGLSQRHRHLLCHNSPCPTAAPTFSLPSSLRGGSAATLPTLPLTVPLVSAMAMTPPRGPSPLKVTCTIEHVGQGKRFCRSALCSWRSNRQPPDRARGEDQRHHSDPCSPQLEAGLILVLTCTFSSSLRKHPMSSAPISVRPRAAVAVGAVWWRVAACRTHMEGLSVPACIEHGEGIIVLDGMCM